MNVFFIISSDNSTTNMSESRQKPFECEYSKKVWRFAVLVFSSLSLRLKLQHFFFSFRKKPNPTLTVQSACVPLRSPEIKGYTGNSTGNRSALLWCFGDYLHAGTAAAQPTLTAGVMFYVAVAMQRLCSPAPFRWRSHPQKKHSSWANKGPSQQWNGLGHMLYFTESSHI